MMKTFLTAKWQNIIMANYAVDPSVLKPYLPTGVELDFYEGKTYVSLVGFLFKGTCIFGIPIPGLGTFEEINLRFYVKRKIGDETRRGVVFINETVPYKMVAWMANILYKEHYTVVPTKYAWEIGLLDKKIQYQWKLKGQWQEIFVSAKTAPSNLEKGSFESFIFEHYYGYTKVANLQTEEYAVHHPSWKTNKILQYKIICDFNLMYGADFAFLSEQIPDCVILAEGSAVSIDWKRNKLSLGSLSI